MRRSEDRAQRETDDGRAPRLTTMRDIAREAGVSQSTVSRVLNDAPTRVPIAAETRERVTLAARRLGYRPNPLARGLRGAPTMLLGAVVRDQHLQTPALERLGQALHAVRKLRVPGNDAHRDQRVLHRAGPALVDGAATLELSAEEREALEAPAPPPVLYPQRMLAEQVGLERLTGPLR